MIEYSLTDHVAGKPYPEKPFFMTAIWYDIPNTVAAAIRGVPSNCVGVTLGSHPPRKVGPILEALEEKGLDVRWVECERIMLEQ